MAESSSLDDLLKDVPGGKLGRVCKDKHLCGIAPFIRKWESVAPALGLTQADIEVIIAKEKKRRKQRVLMLTKWQEQNGKKATYRRLATVFWKLQRADLVEELCEILLKSSRRHSDDSSSSDGENHHCGFDKSEQLGPQDLGTVLNELVEVCDVWENIGLGLKLTGNTLSGLKASNKEHKDCLRDMLRTWLNKATAPSWRDLVQALNTPMVGRQALANRLREKFCSSEVPKGTKAAGAESGERSSHEPISEKDHEHFERITLSVIKASFAEILDTIQNRLSQSTTFSLDGFKRFVAIAFPPPHDQAKCDKFISSALYGCQTVDAVFTSITQHQLWDHLNIPLLEKLIKRFLRDDEEVNTHLQQYKTDLGGFTFLTKIEQFVLTHKIHDLKHPELFTKLEVKTRVAKESLQFALDLCQQLTESLSLSLILHDIIKGCVCVTFIFPAFQAPHAVREIPKFHHIYEKNDICWMRVNGREVYSKSDLEVRRGSDAMEPATAVTVFQDGETDLDSQVSDEQIEEMAVKMVRWEYFAPFFGLSEAEQEEIRKSNPTNYRQQKRAALYAWRQKYGRRSTYRALLSEFDRVRKQKATYSEFLTVVDSQVSDLQIEDMVAKMAQWEYFASCFELSDTDQEESHNYRLKIIRQQKRAVLYAWRDKNGRRATYRALLQLIAMRETNALEKFRGYLIECYAQAPHPSQSSWPYFKNEAYVNLPLFEAPVEPNASPQKPVKLGEIFMTGSKIDKRKVILLEGVAGSGKTALIWRAYRQWAEGTLFARFSLLIHLPLEDPMIRSAKCLADIIPLPSQKMRNTIAEAIASLRGKGVCFLLDGWDELPPGLQKTDSFLYKLIEGRSGQTMLPHCSIIVTSRPGASGSLRPLLTARIVIERLDRPRIDELLSQCLSHEESEELSGILNHRPQVANLCNLPINATIAIYLFCSGIRTFPETRTGLFKALLCSMLIRHIQLRTEHDAREFMEEFEFQELPIEVLEKFIAVSSLAFKGVMERRKAFDKAMLKSLGLSFPLDTISLMETHLTIHGFIQSFVFLHYSVQEFLAAWHMTRLGGEEQAKAVSDILHSSPLSPVLPFFAGLTGLSNPAVRYMLLKVTKYRLDLFNVLANRPRAESADRRRLALALLNCIYESQNCNLCKLVNPPVAGTNPGFKAMISFQGLDLETDDCISIGYFMANHTSCLMDVTQCSIGDTGIEALMSQLKIIAKPTTTSYSRRSLKIDANPITSHSMEMVS